MNKKIICALVFLQSLGSYAATSGSYECTVVPAVSVKAYEAGPSFSILVDGKEITVSPNGVIGFCTVTAKKTASDFILAENAMNDCGFDGVDMLIPLDMQKQSEKATLVVSANGSFDVYSCKLNAVSEY